MSRNRLLVGGLVIIAVLVIAYFAFVYPPVSKEGTSGAIGVAEKYRSEQITDNDVMLKEDEDAIAAAFAVMSPEEKAAFFERSTIEAQGRVLAAAPEVTAGLVNRAGDAFNARVYKNLDGVKQVELFGRLPEAEKKDVLNRVKMTYEKFSGLPAQERVKVLTERASDPNMAAMVKTMKVDEMGRVFGNLDPQLKSEAVTLLDRSDRVICMERASAGTLAKMDRENFVSSYFNKVDPGVQFEMLAKAPELCLNVVNRASDAFNARVYKNLDGVKQVELFGRLPEAEKKDVLNRVKMTYEKFSGLPAQERVKVLTERASDPNMAAMVKTMKVDEMGRVFGNLDPQLKSEAVTLLDRSDRINCMGYAPRPVLDAMARESFISSYFNKVDPGVQFEMLAKAPELCLNVVNRASDAFNARVYKNLDGVKQVELFGRLPEAEKKDVLNRVKMTYEKFSGLPAQERVKVLTERASDPNMAAMVKTMKVDEMGRVFGNLDPQLKSEAVTLLDRSDRINCMGYAPTPVRDAMERTLKEMGQRSMEQQ